MNSPKKFASQADLDEKQVSFTKLSDHAYAYTAEGDPNTGIIIGDDAVRVLGASAYAPQQIIASQDTYDLIVERGEQDKASEIGRFPRLFRDVESVPAGVTWPTITTSRNRRGKRPISLA